MSIAITPKKIAVQAAKKTMGLLFIHAGSFMATSEKIMTLGAASDNSFRAG
jgi:hypothetical protein